MEFEHNDQAVAIPGPEARFCGLVQGVQEREEWTEGEGLRGGYLGDRWRVGGGWWMGGKGVSRASPAKGGARDRGTSGTS